MSQGSDLPLQPPTQYAPASSAEEQLLCFTPNELIDRVQEKTPGYYNSMIVFAIVCTQLDVADPQALVLRKGIPNAPQLPPSWKVPHAWLPNDHGLPSLANVSSGPNADKLTVSEIAIRTAEADTGIQALQPVDLHIFAPRWTVAVQFQNTLAVIVTLERSGSGTLEAKPEANWMTEPEVAAMASLQFTPISGKDWVMLVLRARKALAVQRSQQQQGEASTDQTGRVPNGLRMCARHPSLLLWT
ncbi:hypothetical protein LTR65_005760 [Meristemomyces frigidus]